MLLKKVNLNVHISSNEIKCQSCITFYGIAVRSFERMIFLQALPYRFLVLWMLMQKGEALAAQQNFSGSPTYEHLSPIS